MGKKRKTQPAHPTPPTSGVGHNDNSPEKKCDGCPRERDAYDKINTAVACVGLAVLVVYTTFAGCQSRELVQANKTNLEAFTASQRPIVSLGRKDGIIAEFVEPDKDSSENVGLKVYFYNGGQSPALTPNVGILINMVLNSAGLPPMAFQQHQDSFSNLVRYGSRDGTSSGGGGSPASIAPQSEFVHYVPDRFSRAQLEEIRKGNKAPMIMGG